jgi:SAM-dependent methyltransferase
MTQDPFTEFKAKQRESWAGFAPFETFTTPPAGLLVRFAGIRAGQNVLDVGTGTGVVALTARRAGAKVTGLDLTPELLARAKENAAIAEADDITWKEGDAENLPFADKTFDVVTSQFGHMFAPRPDVAVKEMLRVLKPGGTIAFSTWPPETFTGRMFGLAGKYLPPPPPGASPPGQWGDPTLVRERLGSGVKDVVFKRDTLRFPVLSPQHYLAGASRSAGPVKRVVEMLRNEPAKLDEFRREYYALVELYAQDNIVHQDFLMTRATKN